MPVVLFDETYSDGKGGAFVGRLGGSEVLEGSCTLRDDRCLSSHLDAGTNGPGKVGSRPHGRGFEEAGKHVDVWELLLVLVDLASLLVEELSVHVGLPEVVANIVCQGVSVSIVEGRAR